jgi:tryptophan synthase alpha chain
VSQRIDQCFSAAKQASRTVLIPFVTAGDPHPEGTVELMHSLVEGGADLIELGIPFSDPMADGPVIQASSERAVERGVSLELVLSWVSSFREQDKITPVVLMGYLNPFERFGYQRLAAEAAASGVDGLLLVDCPPEEMPDFQLSLENHGLCSIRLVAPTTTAERLSIICRNAKGFVYYVSLKGTTGAGKLDSPALAAPVQNIRSETDLPVAVGFGIKDAESAFAVAGHADAVVIGSALVSELSTCASVEDAATCGKEFVAAIRLALDGG